MSAPLQIFSYSPIATSRSYHRTCQMKPCSYNETGIFRSDENLLTRLQEGLKDILPKQFPLRRWCTDRSMSTDYTDAISKKIYIQRQVLDIRVRKIVSQLPTLYSIHACFRTCNKSAPSSITGKSEYHTPHTCHQINCMPSAYSSYQNIMTND